MTHRNYSRETGATLVVSLIMLTLITLMIMAALTIGSANFKTVTNMQFRDEAVDAANRAIDVVVSSNFAGAPAQPIPVDLDANGTVDYVVQVDAPVCIRAVVAGVTPPSSESLPPVMAASSNWNTTWDIRATVAGNNPGQAAVEVRAGARVLLSQVEKDLVCS